MLLHDRQDRARAAAITRKFGAKVYGGAHGHYVDVLLAIRATYFLGNPVSSFASNIAVTRWALEPLVGHAAPSNIHF